MEEVVVGKTCPYYQSPIKDEENIIVCTKCKTPHHRECWDENKECTTFGCDEKRGALASEVAINSAESVDLTKKNCPYCTEEILIDAIKCKHCHNMLEELTSEGEMRRADLLQEEKILLQNSLLKGKWSYNDLYNKLIAGIDSEILDLKINYKANKLILTYLFGKMKVKLKPKGENTKLKIVPTLISWSNIFSIPLWIFWITLDDFFNIGFALIVILEVIVLIYDAKIKRDVINYLSS